jgi:uncharacterized membrane protein
VSDTTKRSIAKAITWRVTGTASTFLIALAITDNAAASTSLAAVQLAANTLLYFVHERVWNRLTWGRVNV